ncbi:MAG: OB-fold domain-containing protein [Acidimicrobiia bacterium]|jgi:3-hydroxy-3-methylglutaryl CoA synthase
MRGIIASGGYLPYRRLDRSDISKFLGSGGGRGTRTVASYDEDTTTMGVEAGRVALKNAPPGFQPDALWFATVDPAYIDKTNATTIHAALRLEADVALDFGAAARSAVGALKTALGGGGSVLVVTSDIRTGQPGSGDEANGGDGAAAIIVGDDSHGPVIAEYLGGASVTEEFIDRWRTPGDSQSGNWEERFGEGQYLPLGENAWKRGLDAAGVGAAEVDHLIVSGLHARAVRAMVGRLGEAKGAVVDDRTATVGNAGAAQVGLLLTDVLERAEPGQVVAVLSLADGADLMVFRTTEAIKSWTPVRTVAAQAEWGQPIGYGKFLAWRGTLAVEGPRRPAPSRISASVSARSREYKYAFVGSKDRSSGALHLPPARISREGDAFDDMDAAPMSEVEGTIAIFTIDRIAYSPSPPITFAVVDFDGGGRLPVELCDLDADALQIGDRVELTFRRLFTAEGIHNYFWKARPVR